MSTTDFYDKIQAKIPYLRKSCWKFVNNEPDAQDLVQETIYKALKNKNKFKAGTNLSGWLYTILKNTYLSRYQNMKRRQTDQYLSLSEGYHHETISFSTVENHGPMRISTDYILEQIDLLQDSIKTPFMMYFRGYRYLEIAEKLNVPIGTVKNRIHIARKQLMESLEETHHAA